MLDFPLVVDRPARDGIEVLVRKRQNGRNLLAALGAPSADGTRDTRPNVELTGRALYALYLAGDSNLR
jgi:hypothetical protein